MLVITERNGVLTFHATQPDGSLRQCGVLDSDGTDLTHNALAQLGARLATDLHWPTNPPPTKATPPKALPRAKPPTTHSQAPGKRARAERTVRNGYRQMRRGTKNDWPAFSAEVYTAIVAHPGSNASQLADHTRIAQQTVQRIAAALRTDGKVRSQRADGQAPATWYPT